MSETENLIQRERRVTPETYKPIPVVLERGQGVWLWDVEGNRYLDMMSAYSAVSLGHANPEILKVMGDQAKRLAVPSRAFYNDQMGRFLEKLCASAGLDQAIPMNTGAEAVETAIKVARRWGYEKKGIDAGQAQIIVANNNFHGRTTTIVGFSSEPSYSKDFGPFDGGFCEVPFGDAEALEAAITPHTCAYLVEPIQGEGGIIVPPEGYFKKVREICDRHNVLLILDEIQTGLCRTGKMYAYEHEGIQPDGLILGKALGGGVYPVSAFLANRDIMDVMGPGSHGSTFGGNPLASAIGHEVLSILHKCDFATYAEKMGRYLTQRLREINAPAIREVRGRGLLIGVDFDPEYTLARPVCLKLMERGILTKETHETVVRLAPALLVQKDHIDMAVDALRDVLEEL